jgi:ubiquinone/menaquinone biosynthesis C-methylase UbiE
VLLGDGERLPFVDGSFELAATLRTLHHTPHPELLLSELRRVVRADGRLLVADQLAPDDPDEAVALNRFESAREPSTTLILTEADLRRLFAEQRLVVEREEIVHEPRDLERYLDLAGCEGVARDHARSLAPAGYEGVLGWFVLRPARR